jgi:hypothetical protein
MTRLEHLLKKWKHPSSNLQIKKNIKMVRYGQRTGGNSCAEPHMQQCTAEEDDLRKNLGATMHSEK